VAHVRQLHDVLIVEGSDRARRQTRAALDGEPVALTEVATGAEARAVLADHDIEVALVALALADVDSSSRRCATPRPICS
jgi:DNA-binding response OmpR family regulator